MYTYKVMNEVREKIATLTDSESDEVIFTSGTTDSLNKFAQMYSKILKQGDEIILQWLQPFI
nr:aminotransferase class V-fold PLP-dependent enzyme [Mycoplasmopsis bovis]